MKKTLTEIVFILDRSGSMSGLESDTIGGFNSLLKKQKKEDGRANITTVLFDDEYKLLHDQNNILEVANMTEADYYVRGTTALLDAIGKTINKMISSQKNPLNGNRADKVIFFIITDGRENASIEYGYPQIKRMIEDQKKNYDWEFFFMGANIDAIKAASQFGINRDRAVNYHADGDGVRLNYEVINETVTMARSKSAAVDKGWKQRIEKDFERRKK